MEYKGNKVWGVRYDGHGSTILRWIVEIVFYLAPGILAAIGALAITAHNEAFLLYYNSSSIDVFMALYGIIACIVYVIFTTRKPLSPVAALGVVLYMVSYYVYAGHYGSTAGYIFLSVGCVICLICCISSVVRFTKGTWRKYYEVPCQNEINRINEAENARLRAIAEETRRREEAEKRAQEKKERARIRAQEKEQARRLAREQEQAEKRAREEAMQKENQGMAVTEEKSYYAVTEEESNNSEQTGISDTESPSEPKGVRQNKGSRRKRD